jgi:hypothetical protein
MRPTLAAVVLVGLSVGIAHANEPEPTAVPSMFTPENDWLLAKQTGAQPQKIGILTYYPNNGGGYTFMEGEDIVFYALPFLSTTYPAVRTVFVSETRNGKTKRRAIFETVNAPTIGKSQMPFGGQTVYRGRMMEVEAGRRRTDIPLAKWTRDAPDGKFRLSIMEGDRETQVKLKSIVPVLDSTPTSPITYEPNKRGNYTFFQNGRRIAYSEGATLFLCPASNVTPRLTKDSLILDATPKGGRGWLPTYWQCEPRPFTGPQQEEIVNLLFEGRDPTENGKRHQLTTDSIVRIKPLEFEPPPSR